jgi:hypothetical protein
MIRCCTILLFFSLGAALIARAQTSAQRALENEPEVRQINGISEDLKRKGELPEGDIDKPSTMGMAFHSFIGLKTQ